MDDAKITNPIVIDNVRSASYSSCIVSRQRSTRRVCAAQGSGFIKAGFAGEERPACHFAS